MFILFDQEWFLLKRNLYYRLCFMMFLYYFSLGLITPILTQYLTGSDYLGFSGSKAGWISAMQALAIIFSPLLGAFVTDRLLSAERLLALLQVLSGVTLILLPFVHNFTAVMVFFTLYLILFNPGIALTNTIALHQCDDLGHRFGNIRKWGTIGWVVAGLWVLLLSSQWSGFDYRVSFYSAGIIAIGLGIFSFLFFTPPKKTPVVEKGFARFFPIDAVRFLFRKDIFIILLISIVIKLVDKYYYFGCSPFLSYQGVSEGVIQTVMSIGQVTEVLLLIFLGRLILKFGFKRILICGIIAEVFRFLILAFSPSVFVSILAFPFHGFAFAFFFSTAFIYIDRGTNRKTRAGVQHFYALITGVVGNFFGAAIPGWFVGSGSIEQFEGWMGFWLVPALMSLIVVFIGFLLPKQKIE